MTIESFSMLLARLRAGDQDAATQVFRRYVGALVALASRNLDGRFRSKVDPEDMVQSAYGSFVRADGRLPFELADWENLWDLLAMFTVRKCSQHRKHYLASKRDVAREASPRLELDAAGFFETIGREPTPYQATVLTDTLAILRHDLNSRDRLAFELVVEGYTMAEVSNRCGCSERTVARTMDRVKARLLSMEAEPPGTSL